MGGLPWYITVFSAIGILALLTGIVTLFFALGRRPQRMWTDQIPEAGSHDFIRSIAALLNVPMYHGGRAELLNNGDGFITALLRDFNRAEHSINFMVYIWEPGEMSRIVTDALVERARAGLQVRVLLDGLGGIRAPDEHMDRIREAGGRVATFRPPALGKLLRFHKRNHRRAIVLDGRVGFTGGAAVGDKWLGNARNADEWRDSMVRVTGPAVESLQSAFSELWAFCTGEVLTGESFFPEDHGDVGTGMVRSLGLSSSPAPEEHPLRLLFYLTFLAARERLWITTPYFVPDRHTRQVVKRRARAGVDVRILMPDEHTDAKPIRRASHSYFQELLDAGVRIYEYQPTMIHIKSVVVDSRFCVVGSANMDIRSKELNEENVLGITDVELAASHEQAFLHDLERAREIDRVAWSRRGYGARLIERVCVLFAEQY